MTKYSFTGEIQNYDGKVVKRIIANNDIVDHSGNFVARKGKEGGFIEKESNLGHEWSCWVKDDAIVFENAIVCGDALVGDSCVVYGNAIVCDDSVVKGISIINGNSRVSGCSNITGSVHVFGNAVVLNSFVCDFSIISGAAIVEDSKIKGHSVVSGCTRIKNGSFYSCRPSKCEICKCNERTNYYEVI